MLKISRVTRSTDKKPVSVGIQIENVTINFCKHATERKVVESGRSTPAQVYDPHNLIVPAMGYTKALRIAYAILYPKAKTITSRSSGQLYLNLGI